MRRYDVDSSGLSFRRAMDAHDAPAALGGRRQSVPQTRQAGLLRDEQQHEDPRRPGGKVQGSEV